MRRLQKSKILLLTLLAGLGIAAGKTYTTLASDDNIEYVFEMKINQINTTSSPRYRQTTNIENPWKVNMTHSGEGTGTITRYWIENPLLMNVSGAHDVKAGSGAHYYDAYADASETNVHLTAENNNIDLQTYEVYGYWDEETE